MGGGLEINESCVTKLQSQHVHCAGEFLSFRQAKCLIDYLVQSQTIRTMNGSPVYHIIQLHSDIVVTVFSDG